MLIIDGSNVLAKCRYVAPEINWKFYAYSSARSILAALHLFKDKSVVVCWDHGGSFRRKKIYEDYKKHPPIDTETPEGQRESLALEEYCKAREWLHTSLPKMGIQSIKIKGIEADDIAWCLVDELLAEMPEEVKQVVLITSDVDWQQILRPGVVWYNPMFKKKDEQGFPVEPTERERTVTFEDFIKLYQSRERFVLRKALLGDKSDNIPKSHGLGESKVDLYLDKIIHGENIIDKSKVSQNLQQFIESGQFDINKKLLDFTEMRDCERKIIRKAYKESRTKVTQPNLLDWIALASEIDSNNMLDFGRYLEWS